MPFQMENSPFQTVERMSDGLRSYFGRVYHYMTGGLVVSAATAYLATHTPLMKLFYTVTPQQGVHYSPLGWIAIIAPLILIFMISRSLSRLNTARAQGLFWLFSALMGVSFPFSSYDIPPKPIVSSPFSSYTT